MFSFIEEDKKIIDKAVDENLVAFCDEEKKIIEAMRYSALGGKRLRAIITIEFAKMLGCPLEDAIPYAVAVECIQAYSLIHDDLPCMDDDDMRRGKPSCHIAFGEGNAVLAGDALLTNAFTAICKSDAAAKYPERAVKAIAELSEMTGYRGMVSGQVLDLEAGDKELSPKELDTIHALKTVAFFRASANIGCIIAGADESLCSFADGFAKEFGRAFQIVDDLLDFSGDIDDCEPSSYIKVNGLDKTKVDAYTCISKAGAKLFEFDKLGYDTGVFALLLDFLISNLDSSKY